MARIKKSKFEIREKERRSKVFEDLWKTAHYQRANRFKDLAGRQWNMADAEKNRSAAHGEVAKKLDARFRRAIRRINEIENLALKKAGFPF